jgi:hypothetical protein
MGHHDAENDLEHASDIGRWSADGECHRPSGQCRCFPRLARNRAWTASRRPPELVDTEAGRIIEECYEQALATLRGSRDRLDRLAHTLMDRETLGENEAHAAAGARRDTAPARGEAGESPRNQEWRCMAADPTGRARTWLSAAVRTAPGGRWRRPGTARR